MFCPNCGNELDLFADKCLKCGTSFKSLSLKERKSLERKTKRINTRRITNNQSKSSTKRRLKHNQTKQLTTTRIEYNNGYATLEGMSIKGTKFNKGSFKRRHNNEGCGFSFPVNSLNHDY